MHVFKDVFQQLWVFVIDVVLQIKQRVFVTNIAEEFWSKRFK